MPTKEAIMASKNVKVIEVSQVDGKLTVFGTVGETPFTASPFQWGSKMLMKVEAEGLDRGSRIAIGHAAKRALKVAELALPEAVLKRPRKAKVEVEPVQEVAGVEELPVGFSTLDEALASLE
jgi:hypothetical protein